MLLPRCIAGAVLTLLVIVSGGSVAVAGDRPPADPEMVFSVDGADTLRTNLMIAEALLGEALDEILTELPAPPASVVLVPSDTEPATNLATAAATHRLMGRGYTVYMDDAPVGTDGPVLEFRYRVQRLDLAYPDHGRRFVVWKGWTDRRMDLVAQLTLVDGDDHSVVESRRVVRVFQDRVESGNLNALESPLYAFTQAESEGGGWQRRLEEVVVLGTLAGLVTIYFSNTE